MWSDIKSSADSKKIIALDNYGPTLDGGYIYVYTAPNAAPTASNVSISGDNYVGEVLTGHYSYNDAENDLEGGSTFRWLRNGVAISGATGSTYTTTLADLYTTIRFEVRPRAQTGTTLGTAVASSWILIAQPEPTEIEVTDSSEVVLNLKQLSALSSSINIPNTASSPTLNLSVLAQSSESGVTVTVPQILNINATTTLGQVQVAMPANITITAPTSTWSAIINLPQVRAVSTVNITNSTVLSAIKIGDPEVSLSFDKAVKLTFSGYAGKNIGYYDSENVFHAIADSCAENSQDWADNNIATAGDCRFDEGEDLIVWTKHFTDFVVYEDAPIVASVATSSAPPAPACLAVTYADWRPCQKGFNIQFRAVASQSPNNCSLTVEQRQSMERSCVGNASPQLSIQNQNSGVDLKNSVFDRERALMTKINQTLARRLSGRILLQVEEKGEAWYVNPLNNQRYYLGRPDDAFGLMRSLGLGATSKDIAYFLANSAPQRLSGRILLQVEEKGEAYYVNPLTLKLHYLGRPDDAFQLMSSLGLGVANNDIRQIEVEK